MNHPREGVSCQEDGALSSVKLETFFVMSPTPGRRHLRCLGILATLYNKLLKSADYFS